MITLKKNKPNLKNMFDKYIEQFNKEEDEKNKILNQEYVNYLIKKYGKNDNKILLDDNMYIQFDEDDDDDMGYGKSKKNWEQNKQELKNYLKNNKKNKRGKRGNKNKKQKYKNKEIIFNEEDMMMDNKIIYFYRDINNPDHCVEMFYDLHTFDNFLEENGIEVDQEEVNNIMYRDVTHCCINPNIRQTNGEVKLITDNSYGGLYWTCHEDIEEIFAH